MNPSDADPRALDLTQAVLSQKIQKRAFDRIVPGLVRFLFFLSAAVDDSLADESHRTHAQKCGGRQGDTLFRRPEFAAAYWLDAGPAEAPEKLFEPCEWNIFIRWERDARF